MSKGILFILTILAICIVYYLTAICAYLFAFCLFFLIGICVTLVAIAIFGKQFERWVLNHTKKNNKI
jgi:hypothetical protein